MAPICRRFTFLYSKPAQQSPMSRTSSASSPRTLFDALDLSHFQEPSEIRKRFTELAECLLLHHKLCLDYTEGGASNQVQTFEFQLLEIEFYLYFPDIHEDPFCHSHINQTNSGQWYFHRAGAGQAKKDGISSLDKATKNPKTSCGGYRGGTRKGVDLVFGNPVTSSFFPSSSTIHGGILLRSMRSLSCENEVVSGPSLLVDKILELTCSRNIAELVNDKLNGHICAIDNSALTVNKTVNLCFRPSRNDHPGYFHGTIECSPRVGLELSHPSVIPISSNPRVSFIGRMYRFFINPESLKASTRYYNLVPYLSRDFINHLGEDTISKTVTNLITQIGKETFIHRARLEKYITAFSDGYQRKDLKGFVGPPGKGTSANPIKFLTLIGVLCRLGLLDG